MKPKKKKRTAVKMKRAAAVKIKKQMRLGVHLRLKEARDRTGISQSEVARQLKIGRSSVSQWEDGINEPRAARLRQLAQLYNVSHEWLACGDAAVIRDAKQLALTDIKDERVLAECKKMMARGGHFTLWRLETNMMAGWDLNANDIVLVETDCRADARDVVIADYRDKGCLVRVYFPPYLYALSLHAQPAPLYVDGDKVIITGVVRAKFRGLHHGRVGASQA